VRAAGAHCLHACARNLHTAVKVEHLQRHGVNSGDNFRLVPGGGGYPELGERVGHAAERSIGNVACGQLQLA
jgi:hypothetical protein